MSKRRAVRTFSTTKLSWKSNPQPEISARESEQMVVAAMRKKRWVSITRIVRWSGLPKDKVLSVIRNSPSAFITRRLSGRTLYRMVLTYELGSNQPT